LVTCIIAEIEFTAETDSGAAVRIIIGAVVVGKVDAELESLED
jgi:hypothetical protein